MATVRSESSVSHIDNETDVICELTHSKKVVSRKSITRKQTLINETAKYKNKKEEALLLLTNVL